MPKVTIVTLPDGATIHQQLHAAAVDLLPTQMARESLVRWVTEYDGLICKIREGDWFRESSEMEWHEERGRALVFCWLSSSVLQTKIPFYFGAIFHIGRMLQVSNMVLATVSTACEPGVLQEWSSSLAERLTGLSRERRARATLERLLELSREHYSRQLALAKEWWSIWRREVEPLQRAVETLEKAWEQSGYHDRPGGMARASLELWMTANSPSALQISMSSAGVRFKSVPTPSVVGSADVFSMQRWMPLLLASGMAGGSEILAHELSHGLHLWIEAERERRVEPQVQIALERLRAKYGERSPFEEFVVGRQPATRSLRELVRENQLPNGRPSPWLHAWNQTLEEMPYRAEPLPKPTGGEDSLRSGLRLADSAIKGNITNTIRPTEAWNDFVQRLFEYEWVENVGSMAGAANGKAGEDKVIWTLDDLVALVDQVVAQLNGIGYALLTPERSRLDQLLKKASRGESVYGEDAW